MHRSMLATLPIRAMVEYQTGNSVLSSLLAVMVIIDPALDRQCAGINTYTNQNFLHLFSHIRRLAMS